MSGINCYKRVARTWKMMKGVVIQDLTVPMKRLKSYGCATKFRQGYSYVRIKRPELWPNDWILHHDNAPAHKELC
jgi:hypothetical protein